jgi:antitoxin ParD1/3/4
MKMNISLTKELEELVQTKVKSGSYTSASEVIREALRLLQERDKFQEMKLEALRAEIHQGIESGDSTPLDVEEVIKRGRQRLEAKSKAEQTA